MISAKASAADDVTTEASLSPFFTVSPCATNSSSISMLSGMSTLIVPVFDIDPDESIVVATSPVSTSAEDTLTPSSADAFVRLDATLTPTIATTAAAATPEATTIFFFLFFFCFKVKGCLTSELFFLNPGILSFILSFLSLLQIHF